MCAAAVLVRDVMSELGSFAPLDLAEAWDNVGLLLGDPAAAVQRIMTCLTVTSDVAEEAINDKSELIVSHHPVLFRPVQRLTTDTAEGRALLRLLSAGIAVYSPHTAFDSARDGINARLAAALGLRDVQPLRPNGTDGAGVWTVGGGRWGNLAAPMRLADFFARVRSACSITHLQFVGDRERTIRSAAVACGSAAEFLQDAAAVGCDALVTGEARFHSCLEARESGIALILAGHYATERPAVEQLADHLARRFPMLSTWASRVERDPLQWSVA
jgi:dinuclear metal center YbgI/SA1388 family protein